MSVLCCRIDDMLVNLARRQHPEWVEKPLALVGADDQICAVSQEAFTSGVQIDMTPRQAQTRSREVLLRPLDTEIARNEQMVFMRTLAETGLAVEEQTWGTGYVDLKLVATTKNQVQPIVADIGRQLHRVMDTSLIPQAGWDTSKFTARAAAYATHPGHMRLVDKEEEQQFLSTLSISLLPLPSAALQRLARLGIKKVGQFALMPSTAVWQQFGPQGKTAHRWAKGRDERPVCANTKTTAHPISLDFDPPELIQTTVLERVLGALSPSLLLLDNQLEGVRHLRMDIAFSNHETSTINLTFIESVGDGKRLRETISHQLQTLNCPAPLDKLDISILATGEYATRQLALFTVEQDNSPMIELATKLTKRYGPIIYQPFVTDDNHPIAERRFILNTMPKATA